MDYKILKPFRFFYSSRHHHLHHSKFRKYSLPDDPSTRKRFGRDRHESSSFNKNRRVSTQPEELLLTGADRDHLDSHRSDDPRALRRHKISRPSNASMVHIGKHAGGEQYHQVLLKKMYDHSPHAVS